MNQNQPESERWLRQAEYDQQAAQVNQEEGFYAWTYFLCQQAAEKALKAFLYHQGQGPVIGHSTYRLAALQLVMDLVHEALRGGAAGEGDRPQTLFL